MDAVAEAQLLAGLAGDVEAVGVREAGRVAVDGWEGDRHGLAGFDRPPGEGHVGPGDPDRADVRDAEVAHQLLDRGLGDAGIGAYEVRLLGAAQ